METIRVKSKFEAAHRQVNYPGKCRFPHGHTWRGEIVITCERFPRDEIDMSIDFGAVKDILRAFDHKMIVTPNDPDFLDTSRWDPAGIAVIEGTSPSVENVTAHCMKGVRALIESKYPDRGIAYHISVTVQETDNNIFTLEETHTI